MRGKGSGGRRFTIRRAPNSPIRACETVCNYRQRKKFSVPGRRDLLSSGDEGTSPSLLSLFAAAHPIATGLNHANINRTAVRCLNHRPGVVDEAAITSEGQQ